MSPRKKMAPKLPSSPVPMQAIPLELGKEDLEAIATGKIKLTVQQIDAMLRLVHAQIAQQGDDEAAFASYYYCIFGNELPVHLAEMVHRIYEDKRNDRGTVDFAFRGSWKTTTLTIGFVSWRIGKEPEKANLIVGVNDDSAEKCASSIADIIDQNIGWKMVFPHVVPDKEKGWGAEGYEVKRTDMEYALWREKCVARKDPSFVGGGISGGRILGRHPDGCLFLDDIHDEKNTTSQRELQTVLRTLTDTLLPTAVFDAEKSPGQRAVTWVVAVGTPWVENDGYHYLKNTGEYGFIQTRVMERAQEGDEGAVYIGKDDMPIAVHDDLIGWWKLTWPERFPVDVIVSWRNKVGKRGFGRMYLLDLKAAKEGGLKYYTYPAASIDPRWPTGGGVDYASTIEIKGRDIPLEQRSKFAMAYGKELPTGGAVIEDGIVDQCSQLQAEGYVTRAQGIFPNWLTSGVEMDGKGEELYAIIKRNPKVRLFPFWTGGSSKRNRQERILGPWLEVGLIKVSDAETPYLIMLRQSLDDWPNGNMDVIDAVFAYAQTIPHVLQLPASAEEIPVRRTWRKEVRVNPFTSLGRR